MDWQVENKRSGCKTLAVDTHRAHNINFESQDLSNFLLETIESLGSTTIPPWGGYHSRVT